MTTGKRDGQIGVVAGRIKVIDPEEGGKRAILYPPEEGGTIFVNGSELEGWVFCDSQDLIVLEPTTFLKDARIEVKISPDGLYALAAVFPRIVISYHLIDTPFSSNLKPILEKTEKSSKMLTMEQAEQDLRKNNVTYGIKMDALKELVNNATGDFETVARGREMEEGQDGRLEFVVNPEVEVISYEEEDKKADFREKYRYPAVKKGEVIAILHPAQEGKPGQRVTGEVITPKPVKAAKAKCGEGTEFADNHKDIIAQKDGRLIVNGNNIRVVNLLVHNGDVNMESGNIRFNGDIRIFGNVLEGMLVEASGALIVENNCYGATLKAGAGIQVAKNVVKSELQGGIFYALLREVSIMVIQLTEEMDSFIGNLKQVFKGLAEKGQKIDEEYLRRIIKMLLEKSSGLQDILMLLSRRLEKSGYSYLDDTKAAINSLETFLGLNTPKCDPDELIRLMKVFRNLIEGYYEELSELQPLIIAYAQNSTINHSGDIGIIGAGSYFSNLQAGGEVRVQGVFRGGTIRAESDVRVNEFVYMATAAEGSDKKAAIRIKVPAQASIYFNLVHEDTTVQVGKMIYRFDQEYSKVKISYDPQEGMLKITNI